MIIMSWCNNAENWKTLTIQSEVNFLLSMTVAIKGDKRNSYSLSLCHSSIFANCLHNVFIMHKQHTSHKNVNEHM